MVCCWNCDVLPAHASPPVWIQAGVWASADKSFAGNMVSVKFAAEQHEGIMWWCQHLIYIYKKKKTRQSEVSKPLGGQRGGGAWVVVLGRFTLWSRWSELWDQGTNKTITQTRTATANIHGLLLNVSCDSRVTDNMHDRKLGPN